MSQCPWVRFPALFVSCPTAGLKNIINNSRENTKDIKTVSLVFICDKFHGCYKYK